MTRFINHVHRGEQPNGSRNFSDESAIPFLFLHFIELLAHFIWRAWVQFATQLNIVLQTLMLAKCRRSDLAVEGRLIMKRSQTRGHIRPFAVHVVDLLTSLPETGIGKVGTEHD